MIGSGLVSISFRKQTVETLVAECVKNKIKAIEWGGDVHVPHGDLEKAAYVAGLMAKNHLVTASYGSYYRAGMPDQVDFAKVAATAKVLGAPTIRVWAGGKASAEATDDDRKAVVEDLKRCCQLAAEAGLTVSTEYHANTLTDTNESAQLLLSEVGPALLTGWQPPNGKPFAYRMEGLKKVLDRVTTIHVFTWTDSNARLPLSDGEADWKKYLEVANGGGDHYALLEFFIDDSLEQFAKDAATLNRMIAEVNAK